MASPLMAACSSLFVLKWPMYQSKLPQNHQWLLIYSYCLWHYTNRHKLWLHVTTMTILLCALWSERVIYCHGLSFKSSQMLSGNCPSSICCQQDVIVSTRHRRASSIFTTDSNKRLTATRHTDDRENIINGYFHSPNIRNPLTEQALFEFPMINLH